jgi:hypothetical protein
VQDKFQRVHGGRFVVFVAAQDSRATRRLMRHNQRRGIMKTIFIIVAGVALLSGSALAQERPKPVPKDSMRVFVTGCTKGYVFTAGPRTPDQPTSLEITEGMHLRMNGPKKVMADIKAHEGSMIELTGLMKKGQYRAGGVDVGGGIRVGPGPSQQGGLISGVGSGQNMIDVESWRPASGSCPAP